jgi:hypothetical protein
MTSASSRPARSLLVSRHTWLREATLGADGSLYLRFRPRPVDWIYPIVLGALPSAFLAWRTPLYGDRALVLPILWILVFAVGLVAFTYFFRNFVDLVCGPDAIRKKHPFSRRTAIMAAPFQTMRSRHFRTGGRHACDFCVLESSNAGEWTVLHRCAGRTAPRLHEELTRILMEGGMDSREFPIGS